MTYLCAAIFVTDAAQARRDIAAAAEAGAEIVELRMDRLAAESPLLNDAKALGEIIRAAGVPCVVTCRAEREGGESSASDAERVEVLQRAAEAGAAYLDIEADAINSAKELMAKPREQRPGVIASAHDFNGRPDRLYNLLAAMDESPADVSKIVWTARSIRDNAEAFEILQKRRKPTIALCMGEAGLISRVLAKKFGAFLTFAALRKNEATAPGQPSIEEMKRLYRWDALNPHTAVYGVVGCPVGHSMSPAIHNAAFEQVGFDGVYLPLVVQPGYESFKAFMETFVRGEGPLRMSGLSITIPHKENALRYLRELGEEAEVEPLAERIGAVNTIAVEETDGRVRLKGTNTDYAAILDTLTSALSISREALAGKRVAVIGAGGTGRTAVAGLASCGATVVIYNRTRDKADALAAEFNGKSGKVVAADLEKLCDSCCDVYVNTTSVGMSPKVDETPWPKPPTRLSGETLAFDAIYNPIQTKLLREASAAGAKTVNGVEMFVRQAAGQFRAWTKVDPPIELMRQVVEARLGA